MDLFGKTLVLVNFGLSLMMAAIGGAALYYRVDWTDAPAAADGSTPPGELVGRLEKVNQLRGAIDASGKRQSAVIDSADWVWRDAQKALPAQEERRKVDQAWYAVELEHPLTDPKKQPIQALVFDKGRTVPDPRNGNLPQMAAVADRYGQPLKSLVTYNAEQAAVTVALQAKLSDIAKSEQQDADLTARLIGTKELRGLIERIKDEQVKQEDLAKETELVTLGEGQVRADSQLLLLRRKALQTRIKELAKPGVAAGQP